MYRGKDVLVVYPHPQNLDNPERVTVLYTRAGMGHGGVERCNIYLFTQIRENEC
jgi:hypothetical protein